MKTKNTPTTSREYPGTECADGIYSGKATTPPPVHAPSVESAQPAIVSVSYIFGTAPGSVDVSLGDGQRVRVALQWDHVDIESGTLSDAAHEYIASEVRRKLRFTAEPAKSPASTTEAVHTATPGNLPFVLRYVNPYLAVIDGAQRGHEGLVRIQAYSDTLSQKEKELANFIVTACNSHAALLAKIKALETAGKALLEFLEQYPHQHATDISGYESDLHDALSIPSA